MLLHGLIIQIIKNTIKIIYLALIARGVVMLSTQEL